MSLTRNEIKEQLAEISPPSDVSDQIEYLMREASELDDNNLLQEIFNTCKEKVEKNYQANVILWTCLAMFLDKKKEALSFFEFSKLDNPEQFDDVYTDAVRLLEICECSEDEIDNLRRDAEAMFNEDGGYQIEWQDNL